MRATLFASALLSAATILAGVSQAAVIQTNTFIAGTDETAFTVSSTDLVNQGQSTFAGESDTGYTPFNCCGGSATTAALNDGSAGTNSTSAGSAFDLDGTWTMTYALNTVLNPQGYDITGVNSYTGWPDARTDQKYELLYSTVAAPGTFISLGTYEMLTGPGGGSARLSLTDSTGVLATDVAAVQFSIQKPGGGADESVYRELDVIGNASSVPEPASVVLLVAGAVGLFAVARRRS